MTKLDLLENEMWMCTSAEAKKVWFSQPADRWRIMTEAEFDAHISDGPEQIAGWIAQKKDKPGEYL